MTAQPWPHARPCTATSRWKDPATRVRCDLPAEHDGDHRGTVTNDTGVVLSHGWSDGDEVARNA